MVRLSKSTDCIREEYSLSYIVILYMESTHWNAEIQVQRLVTAYELIEIIMEVLDLLCGYAHDVGVKVLDLEKEGIRHLLIVKGWD